MSSNSNPPAGGVPAAAVAANTSAAASKPAADPNREFTLSDLKQYDGTNGSPIYVGCMGKVFDVSSGAGFYGPGGGYSVFAGKDASRGLAKMDLKFTTYGVDDLTPSEKQTLKEWHDKYDVKYPVVGRIVDYSEPNSGPKKAE